MRTTLGCLVALTLVLSAPSARAEHGGLDVEVWTDRGSDAVYQPGDAMEVRVRSSVDGYLLVYEIDAEGYMRLLWPDAGNRGFVQARRTLDVPSERSNLELVVDDPPGQGYLVALVSREPFQDLPWYLRPYDAQAEASGYAGEPDDEEGVTREGRIVGDPFVAMERVRRQVLEDPEDDESFGTGYTSYYVHQQVRYPRYLCYDCHRPGYWAWWDGFDPYYASCSVFDFRINRGWSWGPTYWFGYVPYYYYVPRTDCPPQYAVYTSRGTCFSAWDGWPRWRTLLGSSLRRYKSPPPADYVAPSKYKDRVGAPKPPGLLVGREVAPGRHGGSLRPVAGTGRDVGARERVERPREVARGGLPRPSDPDRRRGSRDDSETEPGVRGIADRDRVAPGRGRSEMSERPRRTEVTERPRRSEDRERPRRAEVIERPRRSEGRAGSGRVEQSEGSRRSERGRSEGPRVEQRRHEERRPELVAPRDEERSRGRSERPKVEAPREEKSRPAESKHERREERREESRGGGRGRPGR